MEKDKDSKPRRIWDGDRGEGLSEGPEILGLKDIIPRQDTPKRYLVPRRLK